MLAKKLALFWHTLYVWLDSDEGVHKDPPWAPRSWTWAPSVPKKQSARGRGHRRGTGPRAWGPQWTLMDPSSESSEPYMGPGGHGRYQTKHFHLPWIEEWSRQFGPLQWMTCDALKLLPRPITARNSNTFHNPWRQNATSFMKTNRNEPTQAYWSGMKILTVLVLLSWKFWNIQNAFDTNRFACKPSKWRTVLPVGVINILNFFKIFMSKVKGPVIISTGSR